MSRNGSGVYTPPAADYPAVASTLIESAKYNNVIDDIATALSGSIAADGQTTVTANLPMNSKKFTGLASGSARTDSSALGQVQDGTVNWVDGGGTADAITATYSPAITALIDGQVCFVRATAANATTTPTFAPNGLTARTIVMQGGAALVAGSIGGDGHELMLRYDLANTQWELLNPKPVEKAAIAGSASQAFTALSLTSAGKVSGATATGTTTNAAVVGVASSSGHGGYFLSNSGSGLVCASTSGNGIYGVSTSLYGGNFDSTNSHGVHGTSTNSYGVYGYSDASVGVYGVGLVNYGVVAEGDTTTPAKAAFRIVPQDTEPSGANAVGDIYVTTAGVLKICTVAGTPGTWVSVGAQT